MLRCRQVRQMQRRPQNRPRWSGFGSLPHCAQVRLSLYASLAQLYEETGNDAEAIRVNEQLLAYFQKMGSAFDMYTKRTREDLARLRAKKMQ